MKHHLEQVPAIPVFPEIEGLKKTKQREMVYATLADAQMPLSAQDIYQKLLMEKELGSGFAISTIYRALSAFEEKGLINQSRLPGSDMAVYELKRGHKHYAMCLGCHKLIALEHCPFEQQIMPHMETSDFTITGHKLELYGYCKDCKISEKN